MDTDALKMSIEDLECSVSTSEFLGSLGVITVGALLALPEIRVHDSIPVRKAASIIAELEGVFESLGVKYRGSLIGSLRPEAQLTATGTVGERWQTIAAWLEGEFPQALAGFSPPASPTAIAAAERELGVTLPDDYKQFLAIHNGQAEFEPMVGQGSLLPVEKLAAVGSTARSPRSTHRASVKGFVRSSTASAGSRSAGAREVATTCASISIRRLVACPGRSSSMWSTTMHVP